MRRNVLAAILLSTVVVVSVFLLTFFLPDNDSCVRVGEDLVVGTGIECSRDAVVIGGNLLVQGTVGGSAVAIGVTVRVRGVEAKGDALLLSPETASVRRIRLRRDKGCIDLTVPRVDPAAVIILGGSWQPLVGLDGPKAVHPGEGALFTVTVDNLGSETVSGEVALLGPDEWEVKPIDKLRFKKLRPGRRASVRFRAAVPQDAAIDRFAIENPVKVAVGVLLAVLVVSIAAVSAASEPALTGVVNINTATLEQLQLLPGIGEARARAIVSMRKQSGGFKSLDDLLEVKGIGKAMLDRLRPFLSLSGQTTASKR